MNTFLPFSDFRASASCLDKRRCFKQVVECYQILNVLDGKSTGWKNHPAVRMWQGYRDCLQYYYNVFYQYCKTVHGIKFVKLPEPILLPKYINYPIWLGYPPFHYSMQANLWRKALKEDALGNQELSTNLVVSGIYLCNLKLNTGYDLNTQYLWPVDKNLQLLPEIKLWYTQKTHHI